MAQVFLAHSSADKPFVRKLKSALEELGHIVWLDEDKISPGQTLIREIAHGVSLAQYVILVLSKTSVTSNWVREEWESKYHEEIVSGTLAVIPILIEDCEIPYALKKKRYANFSKSFTVGIVDLQRALLRSSGNAEIEEYFDNFVSISDSWIRLFAGTRRLDLLMMYSATWRNTYWELLKEVASVGEVRIVLPEWNDPQLMTKYAERMCASPQELRARFRTAANEYIKLAEVGKVSCHCIRQYYTHSAYMFDSGAVLGLYSYRPDRVPTPAVVIGRGTMYEFLEKDFEWLISPHNKLARLIKK